MYTHAFVCFFFFFFFKQKTAYEIVPCDWSSDVCSSDLKLVNGSGQVRAAFAGRRGAAFAFSTLADVSPDTIRLTGSGRIERQPLVLNQAAVLTRSGDGWALAPTSLTFAGGNAVVSGRSGSRPEVHAQVQHMPLEVLDLAWPKLDLSGSATGRLD